MRYWKRNTLFNSSNYHTFIVVETYFITVLPNFGNSLKMSLYLYLFYFPFITISVSLLLEFSYKNLLISLQCYSILTYLSNFLIYTGKQIFSKCLQKFENLA